MEAEGPLSLGINLPPLYASLSGNSTSGTLALISSGTMMLAGSNLTISQNLNSLTFSVNSAAAQTVQTQGMVRSLDGSEGILTMSAGNLVSISNNASTINVINLLSSSAVAQPVSSASSAGALASRFALADHVHAGVGAFGASNTGNTAGNTGTSAGTWVLAGSTNVTVSESTGAAGVHTLWLSAPNTVAQSNQNVTAANGGFAFQTLSFSNAQGVSFATSAGSAIVGSVETSYAASNHSHGNPTLNLTNLSGTTASASNGLTLSLSAAAPGTAKMWENVRGNVFATMPTQQQALSFQRLLIPLAMTATNINFLAAMSGSSGAASGAITFSVALYTMTGSTANSLSSGVFNITWTSGSDATAASRWGGQSGTRYRTGSINSWSITPGDYLFGCNISTGSSQTAASWTVYGASGVSIVGAPGGANFQDYFLMGSYTANTNGFPATIQFSDVAQSGASAGKQPWFALAGTL